MLISVVKTENYNLENARDAKALAQYLVSQNQEVEFTFEKLEAGRYSGTLMANQMPLGVLEGNLTQMVRGDEFVELVKTMKNGGNSNSSSSGSSGNLVRGKISTEHRVEMIRLHAEGVSVTEIATRFQRSEDAVKKVVGA